MRLAAGARLGHYEILTSLGAGGMGEVYQARDTSLGRDVAIKIVSGLLPQDSERLARFRREARLLASLNHAGIATIHGFEESQGTHFLVMELVPGETLAERIARGPIPSEEALVLFQQVAEALEAAHEKGIVHRDLKPANVKITPDGKVKLLDFGLAKAFAGESAVSDLSQSPTLTREGTEAGVILGTPAYLSPEQARGKSIDYRTDVWAFGCILYEALSGKSAFLGETVSDTIAMILGREPDWSALPLRTPPAVRRLLRRCLEKDVRRRLQAIGDARVEIEDVLGGRADEPAAATGSRSSWRRVSTWVVMGLLVILAGLAIKTLQKPKSPEAVSQRLTIHLPDEAPLAPTASMPFGNGRPSLALSRDGHRLVYVALAGTRTQLFSRDMATAETKPIPGTEGGHSPFFSPDGEWVAFFADERLKIVAPATGELRVLAEVPTPYGASWGDDDVLYFNTNEGAGISKVAASGGDVDVVVPRQSMWPEILPSGKDLLFSNRRGGIYLKKADRFELISSDGFYPRYAPTGHLIYVELGKLQAAPFDLSGLKVSGPAVTLLADLRTEIYGGAQFTFSQEGTLVYLSGMDFQVASLVWVDRQGRTQPLDLPPSVFGPFDLSPDGSTLAISIFEGSSADIWLYDIARDVRTRFTSPSGKRLSRLSANPRWTPDGKHIVYTSLVSATSNGVPTLQLFWKRADGSQEAVLLTPDGAPELMVPTSFSPDGSVLAFYANSPDTGFDLWWLPLEGVDPYNRTPPKPQEFLRTRFVESFPRFSPDGRWIAYMSDEAGRREVYVRPFPGSGGKIQISTEGGTRPSWHPNGRELFYHLGNQWYAVDASLSPEFTVGKPRFLFEGPYISIPGFNYAFDAERERFLVLENPEQFKARTDLTVVTNFFDLLRRRVPP